MWEAIQTLFQNPVSLVAIGALVITILILIKRGYFSYKGHGVQLGVARDNEREVLQRQVQTVENAVDAVKLKFSGDYYHTKYVMATVKLLLVKAVMNNHIKDDDIYIEIKFEEVLNAILKRTEAEYFESNEFKDFLKAWITDLIKDLVRVRKYYG